VLKAVPMAVWQELGPKTAAFSSRTWVTEVAVSLARNGQLLAICVVSPSGINELDAEAVRALSAAAPFRDIPVGLFESHEHVTFPFAFRFHASKPSELRAPIL
jgi:TonB family protein